MVKLFGGKFGQCSGTTWAGWTGENKHSVFSSLQQLLQEATCLLEKKLSVLLQYYLSSQIQKGSNALQISGCD